MLIDPGFVLFLTAVAAATAVAVAFDPRSVRDPGVPRFRRAGGRHGRLPLLLLFIAPLAVLLAQAVAPGPDGHWREHLTGAALGAGQLVALAVSGVLARRSFGRAIWFVPLVLFGIATQIDGNVAVAQSIWATTGDPGGDTPQSSRVQDILSPAAHLQYEQGHEDGSTSDVILILAPLAFAVAAAATRKIRWRTAGVVLGLCIIPPPFLWPAYGVLAGIVYRLVAPDEALD